MNFGPWKLKLKILLEKCPEQPDLSWLCPEQGLTSRSPLRPQLFCHCVLPPAGQGTNGPSWTGVTSLFCVRDPLD